MQKPAKAVSSRLHIGGNICAVVFTLIICIVFFAALAAALWAAGNFLGNIMGNSAGYIREFQSALDSFKNSIIKGVNISGQSGTSTFENLYKNAIDNMLSYVLNLLSSFAAALIKNLPVFLISSIVTVVASCYIAKDFDRLKRFAAGIIPADKTEKIKSVKEVFIKNSCKFLKGYSLIALITFFELVAFLTLLKIKNSVLVAFVVAFVDLLPVLGVGTVLLPWSAIEFLTGNFYLGSGLLISYAVIAIIRNFIEPKIIGGQIGINPIFTLLSMFLGLKVAGVIGMLVCPLALTVVIGYYKEYSADS